MTRMNTAPPDHTSPRRLALYHFNNCPYCIDVRAEAKRIGTQLELCNIKHSSSYLQELLDALGSRTVPVLLIEDVDGTHQWLPESLDIIAYLRSLVPGYRGRPLWVFPVLRIAPWLLLPFGLLLRGPIGWGMICVAALLLVARYLRL